MDQRAESDTEEGQAGLKLSWVFLKGINLSVQWQVIMGLPEDSDPKLTPV